MSAFARNLEIFGAPLAGVAGPDVNPFAVSPDQIEARFRNPILPTLGRASFVGAAIVYDADAVAQSSVNVDLVDPDFFVVTGTANVLVDFGTARVTTLIDEFVDVADTPIEGYIRSEGIRNRTGFSGNADGYIGEKIAQGRLFGSIFNKSDVVDLAILGGMELNTRVDGGNIGGPPLGGFFVVD